MRAIAAVSIVVLAACGGSASPTGPVTPAPVSAIAGTWAFEYTITGCQGLRHCFTVLGDRETGFVRFTETGGRLDGVFSAGGVNVDVQGMLLEDGRISLTGLTPAALPDDEGGSEAELRTFVAALDGGTTPGTFEYQVRANVGAGRPTDLVLTGAIASLAKVTEPLPGSSFSGTWTGKLAVRSCRAEPSFGFAACDPEEPWRTHPIAVSLTQSGASVTGTVQIQSRHVPVTGSVVAETVTLTGLLDPGSPATAITRWSATVDKLGRMRGTFSYETRYQSRRFFYDSVELWSVVLRP